MVAVESLRGFLEGRLEAYLEDLRQLAAIDSGTFDKAGVDAVNDWLQGRLMSLGFSVERRPQSEFGDDLLGTLEGPGAGRILLVGHSDTVYPQGTAAARPMVVQGNRVLGPGVSDMKGGLLSGLYAVSALREVGFDRFERISYLCVSDEEIEQRRSAALIGEVARHSHAALTLESARENGALVTARKGVQWYKVEAFGQAAHAGTEPERGRSAVLALAHHLLALHQLNGLRPGATLNVGDIVGGSAPNIVPDYARARLDLRAFSAEDLAALEQAVASQLERQPVAGVRASLAREGEGLPPMPYTPEIAALERLAVQAAAELGFQVEGVQTGGASDANQIAAAGTPVLDGLGPVGGRDHSPQEYIELSSIVPRAALLARLITLIAEGEQEEEGDHGRQGSLEAPRG